jgi:hypothetical protein
MEVRWILLIKESKDILQIHIQVLRKFQCRVWNLNIDNLTLKGTEYTC